MLTEVTLATRNIANNKADLLLKNFENIVFLFLNNYETEFLFRQFILGISIPRYISNYFNSNEILKDQWFLHWIWPLWSTIGRNRDENSVLVLEHNILLNFIAG
jgi:hypothetical protein